MHPVLLDTNTLIYLGLFPSRLSPKASETIKAASTRYCLDLSLWDISMLLAKGRIIINSPTEEFLEDLIRAHQIEALAITPAMAAASQKWAMHYKEPTELLIAAAAFCYDMTLVTKSPVFSQTSDIKTLW